MTSILISQCDKSLDFSPIKPYSPRLPAYAVRQNDSHVLVCGFDRCTDEALILEGPLNEILKSIYSELSLSETARLHSNIKRLFGDTSANEILTHYGIRAHADNLNLLKVITDLPLNFQNWMSLKAVGLREISFLSLIQPKALTGVLEGVSQSTASKVVGLEILETWCELHALNRSPADSLSFESPERALNELLRLRNPQTSSLDEERGMMIKQLPWPAQTQARWSRQGDLAGIEVKFRLNSKHDLDRQIEGLQHLRQKIVDSLWKMN